MLKKVVMTTLSVLSLSMVFPAFANEDFSCKVQVAVAVPPMLINDNVAFNVTNDDLGFNKSITISGVNGSQFIENIPCSSSALIISATPYSVASNNLLQGPIGQCVFNAGGVILNYPENSVSVVYPYDFTCNY